MTALTSDSIQVYLDDTSGVLRPLGDGALTSVGLAPAYRQHDVTGFGDRVKNVINGQMQAPITLRGYLSVGYWGVYETLKDAYLSGTAVTLAVHLDQNTPPTYLTYEGEFIVERLATTIETGQAVTFEASLKPATGVAPTWSSDGLTILVDEFTTAEASVAEGSRTAEPGVGTAQVRNEDGTLTIANGELTGDALGVNVWFDPRVVYPQQTRSNGLAIGAKTVRNAGGSIALA